MKIYFVPGLGFDSRIFRNLKLDGCKMKFLNWIEPLNVTESLKEYSLRFAETIDDSSGETILVGHSFGGIVCQEIAKLKKIKLIVLISGVKSRNEIPFQFKILQPLKLHRLFTRRFIINSFYLWGKRHGYESKDKRQLFIDMIGKQSDKILQWSLYQLSGWKPEVKSPTNIFHIHGDLDKTFPLNKIERPVKIISNADHFLVFKQAEKVSSLLQKEILRQ